MAPKIIAIPRRESSQHRRYSVLLKMHLDDDVEGRSFLEKDIFLNPEIINKAQGHCPLFDRGGASAAS